jgi:hypothetical protein
MVASDNVISTITSLQGSGKTIAEFIAELFKDKFVEIYVGDSYEDISTEQVSVSYPAVFCGKIIGAYRECLIINCAYAHNHTKKLELGKMLFISERAIRALTPVDGKGVFEDTLLRSRETLEVKKEFSK